MRKLVLLVVAILLGAVSAALTYRYLSGTNVTPSNAQDSANDFDTGF